MRRALWLLALGALLCAPLGLALQSPLLAWRQPIYIAAGIAGIVGLALMLLQPLLALGLVPLSSPVLARRWHRWGGAILIASVGLHVGGLWITSPPDVVDALLLRSPTPFSAWGVLAMWALFLVGLLAVVRSRVGWHTTTWRRVHLVLVSVAAVATLIHAVQIEGTMEALSKWVLATLMVSAVGSVFLRRRPFLPQRWLR